MRLAGIPVPGDQIEWLVAALHRDGHADAVTVGLRLERGLADSVQLLALSRRERDVILRCLDDPPDGLVELRGVLLRERA